MGIISRLIVSGKINIVYDCFAYLSILFILILTGCAPSIRTFRADPTPPSYSRIDSIADSAPDSVANSAQNLANWLAAHGKTDLEKTRLLYRWITGNIYYDTGILTGMTAGSDNAQDVLRKRSAVCAGYAGLFETLGRAAGLEVKTINGYAKGSHYTPGDHFSGAGNHAWIAVRIDSVWQLLDPTWGSGYINENGTYIHEFNDYYFLTPPQELIATHFPDEPRWQLLETPTNQDIFEKNVFIKDVYFKHNIKIIKPDSGVIYTKGPFTVELSCPKDVQLLYTLEHGKNEILPLRACKVQYKNLVLISETLREPGEYLLKIFSRRKQESNISKLTLVYKIIVTHTNSNQL
ncbi:MAG TPA: transglutaminase domain-containing protein [bacterium]|nr:transglutaminase domain-containing protein [bacterium]HPN44828.1 transglutaminase domain-containing protein [bacterium]